ncbi:83b5f521-1391-4c71-ae64-84ac747426f8 [Sclerotinia trifoliorum]|uniref:83b5f521-1391-4c71-ae64-84ac747426f8 n=1 Tax=Sclerotinia trifoliorum TaxID=28548 RepID=A0A8H2ZS12_9HELO|nr:83b5f521-1391-4c71-ae64-84ac747426f8 [Sclerotinia trifoliorum]
MTETLRRRLLLDIAELQAKPYPNIFLHVDDENLNHACLILTVEGYGPPHMRVDFLPDYPIQPPNIDMDSNISHPNIMGGQICASILNTPPAYTLKGLAIQLFSFFASDAI